MSQRAFAFILLVALAGCDKIGGPSEPHVTKVTVSRFDSLYPGATHHFTATLTYDGEPPAESPTIVWSSSSPEHASVDADGNVTALSPYENAQGLLPISITARVGDVTGTASIIVPYVPGFVLFPDSAALLLGTSRTFRAYDARNFYFNKQVFPQSWSSDSPGVATVDGAGNVTAIGPGQARITAVFESNGGTFTLRSNLTVAPPLGARFVMASGGPLVEELMASGIYARYDRNCGLTSGGDVYCWGVVAPGTTPHDECDVPFTQGHFVRSQCSSIPVRLPLNAKYTGLSLGEGGGGCALTTGGDVYCFGLNDAAQLGLPIGTREVTIHYFLDHAVSRVPSADRFRAIFAAGEQRCAIQENDIAVCWGAGFGEKPVPISTFGWKTIAARGSCGIIADSSAVCWRTSGGQPDVYAISLPYRLTHIDVSQAETCALATTGELACWRQTATPVLVTGGPRLVSIGSMPGGQYKTQTCGLTSAGEMYCVVPAGISATTSYSLQPLDLGVTLKSFSGNCGIALDDKVYCWKWNSLKAVLVPGQ